MLLEGVSVVEWSDDIASQFAARLLADLGAEVIRFEPPGGNSKSRHRLPWPGSTHADASGALHAFLNAGKRCRTINPAVAEDVAAFRRALDGATIFVQSSFDADFAATPVCVADIRKSRSDLIILSITPLGANADPALLPMSDFVLQHHAGLAQATARPVSNPETQPPLAGADHEGPMAVGVCAAMACVWGQLIVQSGGDAPEIDLASQDFYALTLVDEFSDWSTGRRDFSRRRAPNTTIAPAGGVSWLLPTSDGFVMTSPREDHQWLRWAAMMGQPEWAGDMSLCGTAAIRKENWARLLELMKEWSLTQKARDVAERAQDERVPCFQVSTPADLLDNAQLHHRQFFDRLALVGQPIVRVPGLPMQVVDTAGQKLGRDRLIEGPVHEGLTGREGQIQ